MTVKRGLNAGRWHSMTAPVPTALWGTGRQFIGRGPPQGCSVLSLGAE
jgi:hypothetical protein